MHVASAAQDFIARAAVFAAAVQVWQVHTWASQLQNCQCSGHCPTSHLWHLPQKPHQAGTISAPSGQVAATAQK